MEWRDTEQYVVCMLTNTNDLEYFLTINYSHFPRALGALLVYDITKGQTFLSLKSWLDDLKAHAEQDICIMLVENKLDLV